MNQLVTQELKRIESLPTALIPFVKARQGTPVNRMGVNEAKSALVDVLTEASFDAGQSMADDKEILFFQTEGLFKEFSGEFGTMTITEVRRAFKLGIRGESGQWFGFCPKTYHQFLKHYFYLPERSKAQTEYLNLLDGLKRISAPTVLDPKKDREGLVKYFEEYQTTGKLGFFAFAYYEEIKKLLGVKSLISVEVYREIRKNTEAKRRNELLSEKVRCEKRGDLGAAEAIMSVVASGLTEDQVLVNKQKELALKHYFDSLIKEGKHLKELIK